MCVVGIRQEDACIYRVFILSLYKVHQADCILKRVRSDTVSGGKRNLLASIGGRRQAEQKHSKEGGHGR